MTVSFIAPITKAVNINLNMTNKINKCFKCGGKLEIIENYEWMGKYGGMKNTKWMRCTKCGQTNNWYEKEQWEEKNAKTA